MRINFRKLTENVGGKKRAKQVHIFFYLPNTYDPTKLIKNSHGDYLSICKISAILVRVRSTYHCMRFQPRFHKGPL